MYKLIVCSISNRFKSVTDFKVLSYYIFFPIPKRSKFLSLNAGVEVSKPVYKLCLSKDNEYFDKNFLLTIKTTV